MPPHMYTSYTISFVFGQIHTLSRRSRRSPRHQPFSILLSTSRSRHSSPLLLSTSPHLATLPISSSLLLSPPLPSPRHPSLLPPLTSQHIYLTSPPSPIRPSPLPLPTPLSYPSLHWKITGSCKLVCRGLPSRCRCAAVLV